MLNRPHTVFMQRAAPLERRQPRISTVFQKEHLLRVSSFLLQSHCRYEKLIKTWKTENEDTIYVSWPLDGTAFYRPPRNVFKSKKLNHHWMSHFESWIFWIIFPLCKQGPIFFWNSRIVSSSVTTLLSLKLKLGFALHVVRSSHPCTSLELQNILQRGKFFCCFICLHQLYASSFVSPFLPQVVTFPPQLSWREINNWFHPPCLFPSWMNPNPSSVLWPARWLASDCSFQKEKRNRSVQREFNLSGDVSWFGPSCCTWTERVQVQHHQKITSGLCWIQSIAPNTALTAHSSWVVNYSHSE